LQTILYRLNDTLKYASFQYWKPVVPEEIKKFLGLWMLAGIVKKPLLFMYWSPEEITFAPVFNAAVSRNQFELIS
jgi:hypothetical protein